MSENDLQTLQHLIQDVIAPDVRELKVRLTSLEKQFDTRVTSLEKQVDIRFDALDQKNDGQFKALMSAIAESKAQAELTNMRVLAALSECVAVWNRNATKENLLKVYSESQHVWPFFFKKTALRGVIHFTASRDLV